MDIVKWCEENSLDCKFLTNKKFILDSKTFLLIDTKVTSKIDGTRCEVSILEDMTLPLSDEEVKEEKDFYVYKFGKQFFYTPTIEIEKMELLKYIGKAKTIYPQPDFPYIGIHSGYELLSGSRLYRDWCKKAKFLGITTLGISERDTLSGVVKFQTACKDQGLRSIIGESITIELLNGSRSYVKFYVRDSIGWTNLLYIHKLISVDKKDLCIQDLTSFKVENLILVVDSDINAEDLSYLSNNYKGELYYSIDISEYSSQEKDLLLLENYQNYLDNYRNKIKPILIQDSYYLDKEDSKIQKILNTIGSKSFSNQSKSKWFKNIDELLLDQLEVFEGRDEVLEDWVVDSIVNTVEVFSDIDFSPITGKFFLPVYERTEFERSISNSNEELINIYIRDGLERLVPDEKKEEYITRYEYELSVIKKGGFIDYFLILFDLYRYARENDIWVGVGRGSAAGCLVSYLLGIVGIDPIHYKLLFERFLNEGRLSVGLPDVDCDFQASRRDEIKKYMEDRYGYEQISSIGTYGTFQLKNTVKDLSRVLGVEPYRSNYMTSLFTDTKDRFTVWRELHQVVKLALEKQPLYDFLQEYPQLVELIPLIVSQNKNASVHPAGVVISPKEFGPTYLQHPVKKVDDLIVTEWEGDIIDKAGLLKVDVLGIQQLDKFSSISKLIQKHHNINITFSSIELDDLQVYDLFKQGFNQDVFQLGAEGLRLYCLELQPDNIEDLIATVAVYRPGPIESGTHKQYIKRKFKQEDPTPDEGCDEITKNTYGLIIYQEQVMEACQKLANFTLVEADEVRKALGKMLPELVKKYEDRFIDEAVKNGYSRQGMKSLWDKMAAFAGYAFNRSHAACYAITGYYSQWFKAHYPLEFYTTSLEYSDEEQKFKRISELLEITNIQVKAVDINYSQLSFTCSVEKNTIFWSMISVKWVGEKVVESILSEREKGMFYSLIEFLERMKSYQGVNKRAITYLLVCGAFDEIEGVVEVSDRYKLLTSYYEYIRQELTEEFADSSNWDSNTWLMKQKELTGFGFLDFKKSVNQTSLKSKSTKYKTIQEILDCTDSIEVVCSGIIVNIIERKYQGSKLLGQIEVKDNVNTIFITLWDEVYQKYRKLLKDSSNKIVVLNGVVEYDNYKKSNIIKSSQKTIIEVL